MYHVSRHPNGLTVATANMPHMTSVSIGIWIAVGGRFEPAKLSGVSHFIEHMLFKGTRKRSAREISQAVEGIGGYLNAFTTEENTCFFAKGSHERFHDLLDVLADMFLNAQFAPEEVDKERNVIKEEVAMYLDQPQQLVHELLNETLWPGHALGRPLTGTPETLDQLTRKQLLSFKRRNYVTGSTLIAAAGNLRHKKLTKAITRYAPRFVVGQPPAFQPAEHQSSKPVIRLCTKEIEQAQLALGFRICSRHDPRRYALRLLNTILGDNMSSRLFQVVREDHGLAYSICSSIGFFADTGALTISAGIDTNQLQKAVKLILAELKRLRDKAPSTAELRRARDYLVGQVDLSLEGTENQMMWIGEQLLGYGTIISPEEIKQRVSEVKPRDIRRAAQDFFRPENLCVSLVSPLKSDRALSRWLAM